MQLNQKLKYLRSLENLPQQMIAEILQIERSTYAYYESGKTVPDIYRLYVLARIYGLPMEFFADDNWELDGAEAFFKQDKRVYGHCKSENAQDMQKRFAYYKKLMHRRKKDKE